MFVALEKRVLPAQYVCVYMCMCVQLDSQSDCLGFEEILFNGEQWVNF